MKITSLWFMAAMLATSAHAMRLDAGKSGQVLWYPYYTVNGGHDTYFTVASTSWRGTVAKVRFLDARHGRPVMDLDVYLAPYDSWTAAIYQTSLDSPPLLRTNDRSCTKPAVPAEGLRFATSGFDGTGPLPADDAPHDIARTREGAIEVIAGGSIVEHSPTAAAITPTAPGLSPPSCASLPGSMTNDIVAPGNELYGSAAIIDVADGEYYAYDADAIADFTDSALMATSEGPLQPSLAQGDRTLHYFADGAGASYFGTVRAAETVTGIDAVTALFISDTISNDFLVTPGLGATTDWIVSYPTKRFYIDPAYATLVAGSAGAPAHAGTFHVDRFDREGAGSTPQGAPADVVLPYDTVNVLTITHDGAEAGLFGSRFATSVAVDSGAGVLRLRTAKPGTSGTGLTMEGSTLYGSAVSGFMAYNIVNAHAQPGRLSNYGATFRHHTTQCAGPVLFPAACRRWSDPLP